MTRTLFASAFLLFASAASATAPVTFQYGDPPTARVSYRDVDIRSVPGRVVVERRIQMAARQVCVDTGESSALFQPKHLFADCYNHALSNAVSQLEQLAGD